MLSQEEGHFSIHVLFRLSDYFLSPPPAHLELCPILYKLSRSRFYSVVQLWYFCLRKITPLISYLKASFCYLIEPLKKQGKKKKKPQHLRPFEALKILNFFFFFNSLHEKEFLVEVSRGNFGRNSIFSFLFCFLVSFIFLPLLAVYFRSSIYYYDCPFSYERLTVWQSI